MKKFLQLFVILAMVAFASCGPSEEEKAKMEQEAGEAVDSMMNQLETEMGASTDSSANNSQEEQTQTKESEEAPKQ